MKVSAKQRIMYVAGDLLACEAATLLFNFVRHLRIHNGGDIGFAQWSADPYVELSYLAFPAVMLAIFALLGFYNDPLYKSRYELATNAALCSALGSLVIYFAIMVNDNFNERSLHYSLLLALWMAFFVMVTLLRAAVRSLLRKRAVDGADTYNVIVVGPVAEADAYAARLEKNNSRMGYRVVGIVDSVSTTEVVPTIYPLISSENLVQAIDSRNVKSFVILATRDDRDRSIDTINRLIPFGITILLPFDFYNIVTSRPRLSNIVGEPLVDITTPGLSHAAANLKRIGDIIVASLALIALIPVGLIIALLIRRDSAGPVFYRQRRVGLHRKEFSIIKFRSMIVEAEVDGPALSSDHDSRVTRVGRFLRRYRLDELPQFWNVLCGVMSLVGPRPERAYYLEHLLKAEPAACTIHNVRPGLTSLGMVKYGYASSIEQLAERLCFDLLYIENISFSLDLRILFHTVNTVISGKGI